ncbi:MAG: MarR family winged helix-turn-helix transcriptional regulator [Bacillota bacterium]
MPIGHESNRNRYLSIRTVIELESVCIELEDIMSVHFARYGLSRAKFGALVQLHMAGESGLTQSDLSKKMLVSRANITGLIDRLEKDGLVVRQSHPGDKRAFRIQLTARARELMQAFLPVHSQFIHKVTSALNEKDKETLVSLLEKLKKGLDQL